MALTKIGSIGINTGIAFAGVTTIATLNASDNVLSVGGTVNFVSDVSIGGTVSIAGTLTYEDVTNVDAVGLITARDGIKVGSGITLSVDGDVFFTGIATGNGSGLTALNASNLASGTVPSARLGSGTASSSTFLAGDSTFKTVTGTTINTNANNRVITGSDTANTLNGESTLTYDGDGLLSMTSSSGAAEITLVAPSSSDSGIYFNDGSNDGAISYDHSTQNMNFRANAQTKLRIEGSTKKLLIQRAPSSDVDITVARAQRWGYSDSYQGLIIGNPAVGNMSSLFLNYDPSSNTSGSFAGDGREMVVRKNAKMIVPNAADNTFYNAIEFNAGGDRDDGVSRFRQGIIVSNDSADANVLNDYEEGTFTPTNNSGSGVSDSWAGRYTKIGNLVHFQINQTGGTYGFTAMQALNANYPYQPAYNGAFVVTNGNPNISGTGLTYATSGKLLYFGFSASGQSYVVISGTYITS